MNITPQSVFLVLGIVGIVVAVVLLVIAIVYYVRNDIRAVQDDLSGKARQGRVSSTASRGRRRRDRQAPQAAVQSDGAIPLDDTREVERAGRPMRPSEDEIDTVLDTKLHKVAEGNIVNSDQKDINDDMNTVTATSSGYHEGDITERTMGNCAELSKNKDGEDDLPTEVEGDRPEFVVTRSMLAINSAEVITAG